MVMLKGATVGAASGTLVNGATYYSLSRARDVVGVQWQSAIFTGAPIGAAAGGIAAIVTQRDISLCNNKPAT